MTDTLSEDLDYYALRVPPQREPLTVRILEQRRMLAMYPTQTIRRRRHRNGKAMVEITRPSLTGYVFIAFPIGEAIPWWKVLELQIVHSVVSYGGRPARLDFADVWRLFAPDEFHLAEIAEHKRTYARDDCVRILDGPFGGFEGKIQALTDEDATVLCELFGRQTPVRVGYEQIEKTLAA